MIFNMKKNFLLLCALLYCVFCFSQQHVKVFGIDFNQLTMRQAVYALQPKYTANVYNSFNVKKPYPDNSAHEIRGNITYAGFTNSYAELIGINGKPSRLVVRLKCAGQEEEVMLKLSNAISEKYGVHPEVKKSNNFLEKPDHTLYVFRIGETYINIGYEYQSVSYGSCFYGVFDVYVSYWFYPKTTINPDDL